MLENKYHFNISIGSAVHNAGTKAVNDCKKILLDRGYNDIEVRFKKKPYLVLFNFLKLLITLTQQLFSIPNGSIIIVQYPLLGVNNHFYRFIRILQKKGCFVACIIHDLESLRFKKALPAVKKEILNLNAYNVIISHNDNMTRWLVSNGINTNIVRLGVFDYLNDPKNINHLNSKNWRREVIFAGSFQRGSFVYKLKNVTGDVSFRLYGNLEVKSVMNDHNIIFAGSFPPNQIVGELKGGFGLIWDGDEINVCKGKFGDYLEYNNPHKLSLYIAAGIPIIIPHKSALAQFVLEHQIGFTIRSLHDISGKLDQVDDAYYKKMLINISTLSEMVRNGYFFNKALNEVELLYKPAVIKG